MTQNKLGQLQWFAVLTASTTLALGGVAYAAPNEAEPNPPVESETPPPPKVEPQPVSPATTSEAPATPTPAPTIEHLGPETFPGSSRGLYGGSLWLEPSFHGLQWPQNARTGLGLSGMFWIDSGYETIKRGLAKMPDSTMYSQQGRGVFRVTPAYVSGSFFVQGQAELVGNLCQTANVANQACMAGTFSTDDLWIGIGQRNQWDIKVGRFQGWEVSHLGMGLDAYTLERMGAHMVGVKWPDEFNNPRLDVPALYGVSYLQNRPTDGLAAGYGALHAYFSESLRVELLGKLGTDKLAQTDAGDDVPFTTRGGRLTAIFDIGWLKLKAGGEYQKRTPTMQLVTMQVVDNVQTAKKADSVEELVQQGAGASVQFVIDPIVEFGLNAAIGQQSYTDSTANGLKNSDAIAKSYTTKTFGGFANLRLADGWLAGVGAHWTTQLDAYLAPESSANDFTTQLQSFAALQYLLAGQIYIKAVFAYAHATFQASNTSVPIWNNDMYSGRIRLMYLY